MESLTDDSGAELVYFGAYDWGALRDRMDSLLPTRQQSAAA